jgi:hypothetical protein
MNRTPEQLVQEQLDAYNARDLARFVATFADDVVVYRLPEVEPSLRGKEALAKHYAEHRFNLPDLHADLVSRIVMGNKVIDHECIHGVRDTPYEAAAIYEVRKGHISTVWFLSAE